MYDEMLLPGERLAAIRARVRSVASMLSHMVIEVFLTGERLRAVRALVRSFPSVLAAEVHSDLSIIFQFCRESLREIIMEVKCNLNIEIIRIFEVLRD